MFYWVQLPASPTCRQSTRETLPIFIFISLQIAVNCILHPFLSRIRWLCRSALFIQRHDFNTAVSVAWVIQRRWSLTLDNSVALALWQYWRW